MRSTPSNARVAFTLVELVVSIAIMTLVLGGTVSSVLLASNAIPDANNPLQKTVASGDVATRFALELRYAQSVLTQASNAVEFTVSDRSGDGAPEVIRYEWSTTPGDPLTRQYNGGTVVNVLNDVYDFTITYDVTMTASKTPPQVNRSPETMLVGHESYKDPKVYSLTDTKWIGQNFLPSLPVDATSWSITRVAFQARANGTTDGISSVQLRTASAGLPTSTILEQVVMDEGRLSDTFNWEEFEFSNVANVSPLQGICLLVVLRQSDTYLADVLYDNQGGSGRLSTSNGGSSWGLDGGKAMNYHIYGTVTTATTPDVPDVYNLIGARVALQSGTSAASKVYTGTRILNEPEVSGQ